MISLYSLEQAQQKISAVNLEYVEDEQSETDWVHAEIHNPADGGVTLFGGAYLKGSLEGAYETRFHVVEAGLKWAADKAETEKQAKIDAAMAKAAEEARLAIITQLEGKI